MQPYEILVQVSDVDLVRQLIDEHGLSPCPRLCGGRINVFNDETIKALQHGKQLAPVISLTGKQLYQAVHGAGLPDEVPTSAEVITSILKANKVVDLQLEETDGRFYLHEIKLENGLTIHLGGGARARVVKITKEREHGVPPCP